MTPPRFARRLLLHAVPRDAAGQSVIGDFDEEFAERLRRDGRLRASLWYSRHAIGMWWWSAVRHPHVSHHYPRGGPMLDLISDLRHALRVALGTRGQSILIVSTLAIAIGTTTIGFALADTILLRGLPIIDPEHTVMVYGVDARDPQRRSGPFVSDVLEFRERARTVERISTWTQARATLRRASRDVSRVGVLQVTGDLFGVWGLRLQLGRGLRPEDSAPAAPRVAVLTDRFWTEEFARAPHVIGHHLLVDGIAHEVVGVLTPQFEFGTFAQLAMVVASSLEPTSTRDLRATMVTGRLAPGVGVEQAQAEFSAIAGAIERAHPESNAGRHALVLAANRAMGGPNMFLAVTLIVGTAALVTLIASINVAGVLLSRAVVRQREFALRVALGARSARVFRQLTVEGLVLAVCGAAGGLLVAEFGLRVIRSVDAEPIFQQLVIDWHEVAFVIVLAVIAPVAFSFAPALAALRVNLVGALNATSTRTTGSGRRVREALVISQLAVAVALAIIGGLVARTAASHLSANNGFDRDNVIKFALALESYSAPQSRRQVLRALKADLQAKGAVSSGVLDVLPAVATETTTSISTGELRDERAETWVNAVFVDEAALATLRVPILSGRQLTAGDVDNDAPVALVSREAAIRYFSDDSVVGRRLIVRRQGEHRSYQVVGVTGDVRNTEPERGMPPRVWLPLANPTTVNVVMRFPGDVASGAAAVRGAMREVAPDTPVETLETYATAIARVQGGDQVAMGMLISFASVAVLFAAIGLYGTIALTTNLRAGEFATRFALGAQPRDVIALVCGQAFRLLVLGLVPGVALGLLGASAMRQLLFGVTPLDPLNVAAVVMLLTFMTFVASIVPAVRAGSSRS